MSEEKDNKTEVESLRTLILPLFKLIPTFSGEPRDLQFFIKSVKAARTLASPQMKHTLNEIIKAKIAGPAEKLIKSKHVTEWEQIKECLMEEFGPVEESDSDEEFCSCRRKCKTAIIPDSTQDNQKGRRDSTGSKKDSKSNQMNNSKSGHGSSKTENRCSSKSRRSTDNEPLHIRIKKETTEIGIQTEDMKCVRNKETQTTMPKTKIFKEQQTQTEEIIEEKLVENTPAHKTKTEEVNNEPKSVCDNSKKKNESEEPKKRRSPNEEPSKGKSRLIKDTYLKERTNSNHEDSKSRSKPSDERSKPRGEHSDPRKRSTEDRSESYSDKGRSKSRTRSSEGKKSKSRTSSPNDRYKSNNSSESNRNSRRRSPRPLMNFDSSPVNRSLGREGKKSKPFTIRPIDVINPDRDNDTRRSYNKSKRTMTPSPTSSGKRSRSDQKEKNNKYCEYCQRRGHEYTECWHWKRAQAVCSYCGGRRHTEKNCRNKALDSLSSPQPVMMDNPMASFASSEENTWNNFSPDAFTGSCFNNYQQHF